MHHSTWTLSKFNVFSIMTTSGRVCPMNCTCVSMCGCVITELSAELGWLVRSPLSTNMSIGGMRTDEPLNCGLPDQIADIPENTTRCRTLVLEGTRPGIGLDSKFVRELEGVAPTKIPPMA